MKRKIGFPATFLLYLCPFLAGIFEGIGDEVIFSLDYQRDPG